MTTCNIGSHADHKEKEVPIRVLSYILLQSNLSFNRLGESKWRMHYTPASQSIHKLYTHTPVVSKRPFTFWPTPLAKQTNPVRLPSPVEARGGCLLPLPAALGMVHPEMQGRMINPYWVERLMGFPEGWTNIEHSVSIPS